MSQQILEVKKEINEANNVVFVKRLDDFKKNFEENNKIVRREV